MRTKSTICLLIAAMALAGGQSARAGDKEKYLIGGLIGGWILNQVVDGSSVEFRSSRPVAVERDYYHGRPSGRYEYRQVRVWVPGYYERISGPCGRVESRWVPGHYEYRNQKVWVSYDRRTSHRYGRDRCPSRY